MGETPSPASPRLVRTPRRDTLSPKAARARKSAMSNITLGTTLAYHPPPGHLHKHIFQGRLSDVEVQQGVAIRFE